DAAHTILLETGEPPSLSDVATRAGLARTSAYQYFGSKRELLHAMVKDIYPRWTERIREAMAAAPTDADRILAYAVANIDLVADGAHAVGSALAALDPGEALDEQAALMHREVQEPLMAALDALGVDAPDDVAGLISAVGPGAALPPAAGHGRAAAAARLVAVLGPMARELGGTGRAHCAQDHTLPGCTAGPLCDTLSVSSRHGVGNWRASG